MHNHAIQPNSNLQLDALNAMEKAIATQQAANTRRKLLDSASKLRANSDSGEDYVVELSRRQDSAPNSEQQPIDTSKPQTAPGSAAKCDPTQSGSDDAQSGLSTWA